MQTGYLIERRLNGRTWRTQWTSGHYGLAWAWQLATEMAQVAGQSLHVTSGPNPWEA